MDRDKDQAAAPGLSSLKERADENRKCLKKSPPRSPYRTLADWRDAPSDGLAHGLLLT